MDFCFTEKSFFLLLLLKNWRWFACAPLDDANWCTGTHVCVYITSVYLLQIFVLQYDLRFGWVFHCHNTTTHTRDNLNYYFPHVMRSLMCLQCERHAASAVQPVASFRHKTHHIECLSLLLFRRDFFSIFFSLWCFPCFITHNRISFRNFRQMKTSFSSSLPRVGVGVYICWKRRARSNLTDPQSTHMNVGYMQKKVRQVKMIPSNILSQPNIVPSTLASYSFI